jgi:hypothetical protein
VKNALCIIFLLSLISISSSSLVQADEKVGLDDPRWDKVFESIDKSYEEELARKAQRDAERERMRKANETNQLFKEIETNNKKFEQKYRPFNPEPAKPQNDPYLEMQKQMRVRQQQEEQQRARQDAAQKAYQDQLLGRSQGNGGNSGGHSNAQNRKSSSRQKPAGFGAGYAGGYDKRSGVTANRSRAAGRDALTGKVQDVQPQAQPARYCECRVGDKLVWGTFCAPTNYILTTPPKEDWNSGLVYEPGQFACGY